ncbi:hypothetical protein CMI47_10485 [Candidatus Pacearchaeota archaeon]|nr:hypothetical protein [Candidatus Pacearchaeota archaeon]|tara:strand:- start:1874 stop:3718 length:1845 start_codon:yes stop_codon:yes gene_type:complete
MADKTFFGRLKKLFSTTTVVRKIGDKGLRVVDTARLQSSGNLASNSLVDRYNRIHMSKTSGAYNPSTAFAQLRLDLFTDYESMDSDSIISSALDIYSDESTMKNEYGDVLQINSSNQEIQDVLYNLYYDVLNVEFNLWPWIRNMCKYGDFYLKLDILEKVGVTNCEPLSAYEVMREEGLDPDRPEYVRFLHDPSFAGANASTVNMSSTAKTYYENYEIAHFRMLNDTNWLPYGKSIVEPARKTWKQLTLMEDAMMIHRIMRAPSKRVFNIDIGNIPPAEVDTYMQQVINRMKKTPYMDQNTGDYNLKFNLQNMLEDFYLPTRGGNSGTSITDLGGLEWTGTDDVEYLKNRMMAALRIPKAFLGYEEGVEGKATLAALDVRFARTIERIQRIFVSELVKIGLVHLYSQGYKDEQLVDFSLALTNPSTIYEQEKVELWSSKMNLADTVRQNQMLSEDWIYENIFNLSAKEVETEKAKVVEDTKQKFRKSSIENEGTDPAAEVQTESKKKNRQRLRAANDTRKTRDGESDKGVGRPKENNYYGTDNGARGRDPLGNEKRKRDVKNRDRSIKHKYNNNSPLAREIANSMNLFKNKKSILKEKTEGMMDESNLIDKDLT